MCLSIFVVFFNRYNLVQSCCFSVCFIKIFFELWDHCNWLTAVVISLIKHLLFFVSVYLHYPLFFLFSLFRVIGEGNKIKKRYFFQSSRETTNVTYLDQNPSFQMLQKAEERRLSLVDHLLSDQMPQTLLPFLFLAHIFFEPCPFLLQLFLNVPKKQIILTFSEDIK